MALKTPEYDVIIAGGGPAGLSALLWCKELGLNAILLEKATEPGGQLLNIYNGIQNYLGVVVSNGKELRDAFLRNMIDLKIKVNTNAEIVKADLTRKNVTLSDGNTKSSRAIFIATGVRRRKLNIPGELEFHGRGVLESGIKSIDVVARKTVLVVGGGDAALENALILSKTAEKVILVHRREELTARSEFVAKAKSTENIAFIFNALVSKIEGDLGVESVEIQHLISESRVLIPTDHILVRIGVQPNSEIFRGQIERDEGGYILTDSNCKTDLSGVFAGGDVASRAAPTISSAVGHGATAAKSIFSALRSQLFSS